MHESWKNGNNSADSCINSIWYAHMRDYYSTIRQQQNTDTWDNLNHMRKKPDIKTRCMWSESIYMKSSE